MVLYEPITLDELRNLTDEEVVKRINDKIAPQSEDSGESGNFAIFSFPDFATAQFYIAELDRREKRRADEERDRIEAERWRTDLKYERWIVFLIILEVVAAALLTWWADNRQSAASVKELAALQSTQQVLSHLEESSAATASTLMALQETSKQMNDAVQKELGLSYEASLNVSYNVFDQRISITNVGRSGMTLWGSKVGNGHMTLEKTPRALAPGVPYTLPAREVFITISQQRSGADNSPVPFVMLLRNGRGEELVGEYQFLGNPSGGPIQVNTLMVSIRPVTWSKKTP